MILVIEYLKKAEKFLGKNQQAFSKEKVDTLIIKAVKKIIKNEDINIDVKQLQSNFKGFYRIRSGKVRILFEMVDNNIKIIAIINDIDFRGNIYK